MPGLYGLYAYDRSEAVKLISPAIFRTLKHSIFGMLLIFLICSLAGIGSAAVYQLPDTTQDMGMKAYKVDNQYSSSWGGIVLPFIGGYGEDANQTGLFGVQGSSIGTGYTYYTVNDASEFYAYQNDVIGSVSFKFNLPSGYKYNNSYLMPVSFTSDNSTYQYYIKVTSPGDYGTHYFIEVLDSSQTSLVNNSVTKLGSSSPAYVTFEDNGVKITHVNKLTGILTLWETETGSATAEIPYSYCNVLGMDISGYPFPVEVTFKDLDHFETTKTYDSIPMKIYWLINQVIPDNNQNMYYFFKAVDTVWSTSLSIILLCFSMPFMWLFFAGICGLCTCVLRGSLTSGIPSGIKTFISVAIIPVKLMRFILEMIARLITAIKPI